MERPRKRSELTPLDQVRARSNGLVTDIIII
jgi:hypothetical protein